MTASLETSWAGGVEIRITRDGRWNCGEHDALRLTLPTVRCGEDASPFMGEFTTSCSGTCSRLEAESGVCPCPEREATAEKSRTLAGIGVQEPSDGVSLAPLDPGDPDRCDDPTAPYGPERSPLPLCGHVLALCLGLPQMLQGPGWLASPTWTPR